MSTVAAPALTLRPSSIQDARAFVGAHHRHNLPPRSGLFAVAVAVGEEVVGVGIASRPVARALQDGVTVEVVRCCTVGTPNAASMIYGALVRAAKALGYRRAITYTLASEPGTSLRAANWRRDAELPARAGWDAPSRTRVQTDLFGNARRPAGPKVRWVIEW